MGVALFNFLWTCILLFIFRTRIENHQSYHKTFPRYSQDDSIVSYGHYDPIARKDRCSKCCGDREIEKTSWADCVYKTSPSHHRNHRKCAEHWNLFIRNSKMIRCGGKVLVVLTILCLLGLIFEGSSSSIVSESEKIHLGEEANIVMVRILFFIREQQNWNIKWRQYWPFHLGISGKKPGYFWYLYK